MSETQEPIPGAVVRAAIRLRNAASNMPKRQHQLRKLVAEHPQLPAGCGLPQWGANVVYEHYEWTDMPPSMEVRGIYPGGDEALIQASMQLLMLRAEAADLKAALKIIDRRYTLEADIVRLQDTLVVGRIDCETGAVTVFERYRQLSAGDLCPRCKVGILVRPLGQQQLTHTCGYVHNAQPPETAAGKGVGA